MIINSVTDGKIHRGLAKWATFSAFMYIKALLGVDPCLGRLRAVHRRRERILEYCVIGAGGTCAYRPSEEEHTE